MDFQKFVDSLFSPVCVVSVEKKKEGGYGDIRLVAGNSKYTDMIDSVDKAFRCIDELKRMGIKIAIDDFGTGYSSLSYLNRFPADLLKIDKSFIDKMNTGDSSRQYVAAIISIGHVMGFDVISEGVEEPEQLETLKDIGCDYIQGYLWGRPLSAGDTEKLVTGIYSITS